MSDPCFFKSKVKVFRNLREKKNLTAKAEVVSPPDRRVKLGADVTKLFFRRRFHSGKVSYTVSSLSNFFQPSLAFV
jgi:hypothetical protein